MSGLSLGARGPVGVETRLLMMSDVRGMYGSVDGVEGKWGREDARRYPTKDL